MREINITIMIFVWYNKQLYWESKLSNVKEQIPQPTVVMFVIQLMELAPLLNQDILRIRLIQILNHQD